MAKVIYLDNASTSWPKPSAVAEAMAEHLAAGAATPGRGAYAMARRSDEALSGCRRRLAGLIGSEDPSHIVLTSGATESLNLAILGLLGWTKSAPRVVTTSIEHNAVRRPLLFLQEHGAIELVTVEADSEGRVRAGDVADAADERTALVTMPAASNALGTIQPWEEAASLLRAACPGALVLIDASQSVGLAPIDAAHADMIAFSGHKALLGPTGTGALYVSPRAAGLEGGSLLRLKPARFGGTGHDSGSPHMPAALPHRFEAGTPNTVGFVGLCAALDAPPMPLSDALGHERRLMQRIIDHLLALPGARVLGPGSITDRVGVVSFTLRGWDASDLAAALDASFGICTRAGLHCAPGAHLASGSIDTGGAVRVSPGPFSTDEDIDALLAAITALAP